MPDLRFTEHERAVCLLAGVDIMETPAAGACLTDWSTSDDTIEFAGAEWGDPADPYERYSVVHIGLTDPTKWELYIMHRGSRIERRDIPRPLLPRVVIEAMQRMRTLCGTPYLEV